MGPPKSTRSSIANDPNAANVASCGSPMTLSPKANMAGDDDRCSAGTAQRGQAAITLAEPPQRVQVRQPHIRHVPGPALHIYGSTIFGHQHAHSNSSGPRER